MNPRQGALNRMLLIREASWAVDPVTPNAFLLGLFAQEGFRTNQPRNQATIFEGTLTSKGSWKGKIAAVGPRIMSMDYHVVGYDLMNIMGLSGYTRVGTLHRWAGFGLPPTYQLQKEYTQATAIIHRYPGIVSTMFKIAGAVEGQQQYTIEQLGKGSEARAAIAGTVVVDQLQRTAFNYFDGAIRKDDVVLANISTFSNTIDRKVAPKDGQFQGGQLAAYSVGVPLVEGDLGLIFSTDDGDTFYDQAINDTIVGLSCLWANKPLSAGPTMFLRISMDAILFSRTEPGVGGDLVPDQTQHYIAQLPAGLYHSARSFGTILGPYVLTGANNVFSAKPEAGATVNVTMGTGSLTAAQLAVVLNADGTFSPKFVAYDLNGRLEYRSKDQTVASSVQWQTATANSAHTVLGFDATLWTGQAPAECYVELYNDLAVNYV